MTTERVLCEHLEKYGPSGTTQTFLIGEKKILCVCGVCEAVIRDKVIQMFIKCFAQEMGRVQKVTMR